MSTAPFEEIERAVKNAASAWTGETGSCAVTALTPDASLRRYFRVRFDPPAPGGIRSAVAMWFDSVACPEAAGGLKVDSDEAYVELTRFFSAHGVAVPKLYYDGRRDHLLLIEDLGDTQLATVLLGSPRLEDAVIRPLLRSAVEQIVRIQRLPPQPGFFPFERSFTGPLYRREMGEFEEFLLAPAGAPAAVTETVRVTLDELAARLETLPRVLAHRDFHAWNLMVDGGQIRVIDFQDALLATSPYDLVSLLNDRDMDRLLGRDLYRESVEYFVTAAGLNSEFYGVYDLALLQRDLKVSGRFAKLSGVRGLKQYAVWIPGTLERIGRTLERLSARADASARYGELLMALTPIFPDIKRGAADTLRWERGT